MTPTPHHNDTTSPSAARRTRRIRTGLALAAGTAILAACGSSATTSTPTNPPDATATPTVSTTTATDSTGTTTPTTNTNDAVLPVTSNPITNTATAQTLTIDQVLVENNVDPTTGKTADDHLEIAVTNTGTTALGGFEVFYTITDPTTGDTESYYTKLPDTFTIAPGASRIIHFDNTGAPDHFPDNPYSLYHTSLNGLDVTVEVSAQGAAPQTTTVQKDPGGDETAD